MSKILAAISGTSAANTKEMNSAEQIFYSTYNVLGFEEVTCGRLDKSSLTATQSNRSTHS